MRVSARADRTVSPTSCSRPCATNSAGISSRMPPAGRRSHMDDKPRQVTEGSARRAPPAAPCTIVIFGVTGDLTKRLLVPSLCHLRRSGLLSERFAVLGIARSPMSDDEFRQNLGESVQSLAKVAPDDWQWLAQRCHYIPGAFDDPGTYPALAQRLDPAGGAHATRRDAPVY